MRCFQTGKPRNRRGAEREREREPRAAARLDPARQARRARDYRNDGLDPDVLADAIAAVETISTRQGGFSPEKRARHIVNIYQFVIGDGGRRQ